VLFSITQQVQPASIMADMQSQQAWIIVLHSLSPLVQAIETPSLVDSHLHIPIVRLQQQTIMPFIMQQQLHMPPASMVQRFCIMLQAILSSLEHMIFMPPVTFCILTEPRGTMRKFIAGVVPATGAAMPGGIVPAIPETAGFIMTVAIAQRSFW
jgi:hypothetical protein